MTDIVERLRYDVGSRPGGICEEAADEIERLRAERDAMVRRSVTELVAAHGNLKDYISRLEAERDAAMKLLTYLRVPAQRAIETAVWVRAADEPPPNVWVTWVTNADVLLELMKITDAAKGEK